MEISELRKNIDASLAAGDWQKAARDLQLAWQRDPSSTTAGFVVARFEKLRGHVDLQPHRLAILRSFTVEPMVPLLRASGFAYGIDLAVQIGEFNTYAQDLLDPASTLYRFAPDTVILAVQTRDIAPELWRDYAGVSGARYAAMIEQVTRNFQQWVADFRTHSRADLVVHSLEAPLFPSQGLFDSQAEESQTAAVQQINQALRRIAADHPGVYVLDYDALVARHGREQWRDERKWLTVRLPISAGHLAHMSGEWMRFLCPLTGKTAKAVVVDLDNTLWGGVIGEDGMAGIRVGAEYPGAAYQELQRALLDLSRRGILLAVCSKNNPDEAMQAIDEHPGMLLRSRHFAAMRLNWTDKAQNLREIAAELNIGIDTLAFLDDNPVERQQVRDQIPEVTIIELPDDPLRFAQAVRDTPVFERLSLSAEDRQRSEYYAAQRHRAELERKVASPEDFYRSLEQEAEIESVNSLTLARVAQLTQKTNQFNLTTRRYAEQQIAEMMSCPGWQVLSLKVRDRYADNGLVGVAITRDLEDACEIDTFLLSCRVIGRTVETAFLSYIAQQARARGVSRLRGWFLPTRKNAPAKEFYLGHGFQLAGDEAGNQLWTFDLAQPGLECPAWVRLVAEKVQTA